MEKLFDNQGLGMYVVGLGDPLPVLLTCLHRRGRIGHRRR